jgi:hypothetical protein
VLAIAAPRRLSNREHLRYLAQQACLVCGLRTRIIFVQPRALGRKASDEFAVPPCRLHHDAAHRSRDERVWWREAGIEPIKIAGELWRETCGHGTVRPLADGTRKQVRSRIQKGIPTQPSRSAPCSAMAFPIRDEEPPRCGRARTDELASITAGWAIRSGSCSRKGVDRGSAMWAGVASGG